MGWSSSQMVHQTEMSTTSLRPQGSLWSPRRPPRCWSLQERVHWVSWTICCLYSGNVYSKLGISSIFPWKRLKFSAWLNVLSLCFVDVRLRKLAEEKDELLAQIRKLKNQLEEEKQKHSKVDSSYTDGERMENGTDLHLIEMQSKLTSLPDLHDS